MLSNNPFLKSPDKGKKEVITDFLQTIVLALAFSLLLYLVFLVPSIVDGPSMRPNYADNDLLFASKTVQWLGDKSFTKGLNYDYKRGDVIIFQEQTTNLIKRIIATGGDSIKIAGGRVFVNGKRLHEDYIADEVETYTPAGFRALLTEGQELTVPQGSFFVLGDNRPESKDSRYDEVGFVKRSQIRGRVFIRYWPIDRFQLIKAGTYQEIS